MESRGYAGTINTEQYAKLSARWGSSCSIIGASTWEVVPDSTVDRGILVRRGTDGGQGYGYGVLDTMPQDVQKAGDPVTSGTSRWDTVVIRRDWRPRAADDTRDRTTVEVVPGGAQRAIAAGVRPRSGAGVLADQPIALVRFLSGSTRVAEVVDLRVWQGDGGATARSELARSFYNDLGTRLTIVERNAPPRVYEMVPTTDQAGALAPDWVSQVLGAIPLFGVGAVIGDGSSGMDPLPAGAVVFAQIGTEVGVTDGAGYVRVTWPKPFPNGLAVPLMFNGDGRAAPGVTFVPTSAPWGLGDRHDIEVQAQRAGQLPLTNTRVRVNYIAFGY